MSQSDLEARVIALEQTVRDLMRELAQAEAEARKTSQNLSGLRGQVGG